MVTLLLAWALPSVFKFKISNNSGFNTLKRKTLNKKLIGFKGQEIKNQQIQSAKLSVHLNFDLGLIKIRNTGQAEAKNVTILLDGIPLEKYPGILINKYCHIIPAKQTMVIQACVGIEVFPTELIEIIWDDHKGDEKNYQVILYP